MRASDNFLNVYEAVLRSPSASDNWHGRPKKCSGPIKSLGHFSLFHKAVAFLCLLKLGTGTENAFLARFLLRWKEPKEIRKMLAEQKRFSTGLLFLRRFIKHTLHLSQHIHESKLSVLKWSSIYLFSAFDLLQAMSKCLGIPLFPDKLNMMSNYF